MIFISLVNYVLWTTHTKQDRVRVAVAVEHAELGDKVVRDIVEMIITTRVAGKGHVNSRSQDLNVGILLRNGIIECREAVRLVSAETIAQVVLVADLNVTDGPWLGVAVLGTQSAVLGINRAGQELKLVEGILDVDANFGFGDTLAVQSETGPHSEDWRSL